MVHKLYSQYVPPHRVRFLRRFGLKLAGIALCPFENPGNEVGIEYGF